MKKEKLSFTNKELATGLIGLLCPFPIVGELISAHFLYPIIKDTKLFGESRLPNIIGSVTTSTLMRYELYEPFYIPMMENISKYLY